MQRLFRRQITRLALRISASPQPDKVFSSLTDLLNAIRKGDQSKGLMLNTDMDNAKFIIFSDQHKGAGDLADDFDKARPNYNAALNYYFEQGFNFINLGDCEELWECTPEVVVNYNEAILRNEARFLANSRYFRIFGNHDLEWSFSIQQNQYLNPVFGDSLKIYEGLVLILRYMEKDFTIFLTHGHQGDAKSDGNRFSKWFVAAIWTPVQRYLEINLNSLSDTFGLVERHNIIMSNWSETQQNLILISGHTHKPVFASLDHIDRLRKQKAKAELTGNAALVSSIEQEISSRMNEYRGKYKENMTTHPSYFNSGCCCFEDGDITGIELEGGFIRLIKWKGAKGQVSERKVLEEAELSYLCSKL